MELFKYDKISGRTSLDILGYDDIEVGATHVAHEDNGKAHNGSTVVVTLQRNHDHFSWGILTNISDEKIKTRDGDVHTLEIAIMVKTINKALRQCLHPSFFRPSGPVR